MQKKRIMISALALVVVALVASWGVNAYFNDTEGTPANSVKAGTLDLVLTPGGTSTLPFVATPVYPGWSSTLTIHVQNAGTINGVLNLSAANMVGAPNTTPEPEGLAANDHGELEENMDVLITYRGNTVYNGKLSGLTPTTTVPLGALYHGESIDFTIVFSVAGTVGNEIQDDSVTFDLNFVLDQYQTHEI